MANHIAHFEIFASDVERARKFYEQAFAEGPINAFCCAISLSLLAEGKSVGEVAHAVGYDSPAAFSAAFKQCFGVSPSSYG